MSKFFRNWIFMAFVMLCSPAQAQSGTADDATVEDDVKVLDTITVTGSRLQRETYTSIAPLQIITAEGMREAGLVDTAQILQESTAAAGFQADLTLNFAVLDNGPGASTVSLRGLGDARTLVLLNGRRLAPSGVEGAPVSPDLNLVPASLVRQYDILLDGASSIYGSDAVAGVANILLRKDFEGFEFDVNYSAPAQGAGDHYTASLTWGKLFGRGFVGFGLEHQDREAVTWGESDWSGPCIVHHEIDENGQFRSDEQWFNTELGMEWDECRLSFFWGSRVNVPTMSGWIYHTPGFSNGAWPGFSESHFSAAGEYFGIDSDGDGVADLSLRDYDLNGKPAFLDKNLLPELERTSLMAYGEYTLEGRWNHTPFFELNYGEIRYFDRRKPPMIEQDVPANNPFNICNPNGVRGVDCGLAQDALFDNPGFRSAFQDTYQGFCAGFGIPAAFCLPETFGLYTGPIGPVSTTPGVTVRGDRNITEVDKKQYRFVGGFKGDVPAFNVGPMDNWVYEAALSWTRSEGKSRRPGIRGDRLWYALGWYSATETPCDGTGNPFGLTLVADTATGCVPVDMFAPSLHPVPGLEGDFATRAERDYLFDDRDFDTVYTQTLFTFYTNGYLWDLPGGAMTAGAGFEWRNDDIASIPDHVACEGLLWGYFADCGAEGDKDTFEVFGEVELPLLGGRAGVEELTVNLSARWTKDELYGADMTYSAKLGWRPIANLLIRGTWGTSFRAPALREVFLRDQTSFGGARDPCFIPAEAWDWLNDQYDPALDPREDYVLENCRRTGVDPTALWDGGKTYFSVEMPVGGNPDLAAETSESVTYGFAFEQPWFDSFEMTLGTTYYEIDLDDSIIEPNPGYIINDCYYDEELDSAMCSRISRNPWDSTFYRIDAGFLNRDNETVRGVDVNLNFDKSFQVGERTVRLGVDLVLNHSKERSTTFVSDDGEPDTDEYDDEWGYPDWKGQLGIRINVADWRFTWITRYIGKAYEDSDAVDPWRDAYDFSDTCLGPPDDVLCRDYNDFDDYWMHSASLYRYGDEWTLGLGVRNVFDEPPPKVNDMWRWYLNAPQGYGYDMLGRTYFMNLTWRPEP